MNQLTLVIGNKNYSSWSLRPWLAMKKIRLDFTEVRIPLYTPESRQQLLQYSPVGKVPVLHHGEVTVWESLAICEYIAENFEPNLWPQDKIARAIARSVSNEMHAGFFSLRHQMPMNCRASLPGKGMTPEVKADIERIKTIWRDCRHNFGRKGNFLFGHFTIADAMFAPVVARFVTYEVSLEGVEKAYADFIWQLPEMQLWLEAAKQEKETITAFEL
jgi:glutathione S-transferase